MKIPVIGERVFVDSKEPYYYGYALFVGFQISSAGKEKTTIMIASGAKLLVESSCLKRV